MIATGHLDGDGQFGVIVLDHHLAGAEQLELQAAAETRLVDVGQQGVHFRLARQLLLQLRHVLFHLRFLLAQLRQVYGLGELAPIVGLERGFLAVLSVECIVLG